MYKRDQIDILEEPLFNAKFIFQILKSEANLFLKGAQHCFLPGTDKLIFYWAHELCLDTFERQALACNIRQYRKSAIFQKNTISSRYSSRSFILKQLLSLVFNFCTQPCKMQITRGSVITMRVFFSLEENLTTKVLSRKPISAECFCLLS